MWVVPITQSIMNKVARNSDVPNNGFSHFWFSDAFARNRYIGKTTSVNLGIENIFFVITGIRIVYKLYIM